MVYFDILKTKKPVNHLIYRLLNYFDFVIRRGEKTRTSDLHVPNVAR